MARTLGLALAAPLLVVATSTAAHADGDVKWVHNNGGGCLTAMSDPPRGWKEVGLYPCWFGAANWHDVNVGGDVWIERMADVPSVCLAAYKDHDAYVEGCSDGVNDYQRWREQRVNGGWKLQNVATGECLDSDNTGVYTRPCGDDNTYQVWR
ncbi:ricin-type beta-trefoil lectin domain protein [Streptomyces sp. NPDC052396]|uniref:ricin-type beta-trefoil lectin domain protein n=1 Tax=Streptomyces sp. NPDC052396 TaxID=3365689 RepID=UPI0037D2196C